MVHDTSAKAFAFFVFELAEIFLLKIDSCISDSEESARLPWVTLF
jgi:hypothetical protein